MSVKMTGLNDIEKYPLVLTAKEISVILHISKPTAYEIMNRPDFPLMKIGRCKRVLRDEFFCWMYNKELLK